MLVVGSERCGRVAGSSLRVRVSQLTFQHSQNTSHPFLLSTSALRVLSTCRSVFPRSGQYEYQLICPVTPNRNMERRSQCHALSHHSRSLAHVGFCAYSRCTQHWHSQAALIAPLRSLRAYVTWLEEEEEGANCEDISLTAHDTDPTPPTGATVSVAFEPST